MINIQKLGSQNISSDIMTVSDISSFSVHQLSGVYLDDPTDTFSLNVVCANEIG